MKTCVPARTGSRIARVVVGAIAGVALVAGTVGTSAAGVTSAPARQLARAAVAQGDYLALGDSVAFGYRPPQVTLPTEYAHAANFKNYADDLAAAEGLRLTNASCPGETTASMISTSAISNGCENSPTTAVGYRTAYPLHIEYTGSQLSFAVRYLKSHPNTRLVTIDIGANDAFVCQATTRDKCTGTDFLAVLGQIRAPGRGSGWTSRRGGPYAGSWPRVTVTVRVAPL